jgi:short-subunit dehydrogenase
MPPDATHGPSPVILITGASSGIGEATARLLAREPGAAIVLVARRQERLAPLAEELGSASSFIAVDLLDADAPRKVREHVEARHGRLDLLVNNAGAAWRARFADGGYENVRRTMAINFDAPLRLTEELLPLLRRSSPSAIVNVSSTAARVARAGTGAYSASKFALTGWSDALAAEEREHGIHVGLVLPGFIATEGFPQSELMENTLTRRIVSTPERAAEAIREAGLGGRSERYVPRPYWLAAALRILAPGLMRRAIGGRGAARMTTTTGADLAERDRPAEPAPEPGVPAPSPWEPGTALGRSPLPPGDRSGAPEEQG